MYRTAQNFGGENIDEFPAIRHLAVWQIWTDLPNSATHVCT